MLSHFMLLEEEEEETQRSLIADLYENLSFEFKTTPVMMFSFQFQGNVHAGIDDLPIKRSWIRSQAQISHR